MPLLDDTAVLQVMRGFNPWWQAGVVPPAQVKRVRRIGFHEVRAWLAKPGVRRAVMLSGARRVGKSTILYQIADDYIRSGWPATSILYVSFDHPVLKLSSIGEIVEIFRRDMAGPTDQILVLFDEVHYAADWDRWLKILVDQNPTFRILATGSASPALHAKATESGVGRWVTVRVPTLSFHEYVQLRGAKGPSLPRDLMPSRLPLLERTAAQRILAELEPLAAHFTRYLLVGGFPETASVEDLSSAQRLMREDVVDRVLKRDMTALYGIRNVLELERLFTYLCFHTGELLNVDAVSKEMRVSRVTVSNYLNQLEWAHLIYRSYPVDQGGKKAAKAQPKVYLADPALRSAVLLKGAEVLTDPTELGLLVETAVYKHLTAYYYGDQPFVGFWRDRDRDEVDVVVALPSGRMIGVEVKYREHTDRRHGRGLAKLAARHDLAQGFVVTKNAVDFGPVDFDFDAARASDSGPGSPRQGTPQIFEIPAFAFLYLLGHAERERVG